MWLWIVASTGGLLALYLVGRYQHAAVLRDWEFLLTPSARRSVANLEEQRQLDATMADYAHAGALRAQRQGELHEALRLLSLAFSVVEQATPDRLTRLRAMRVTCRMASAILPLPPVDSRAFRLAEVRTLAQLSRFAHEFLVATRERFLLRLHVLAWGFRLVVRSLGRVTHAAPRSAKAWQRFEAGLADFKTLDREHVLAFSAFLASVEAEAGEVVLETVR